MKIKLTLSAFILLALPAVGQAQNSQCPAPSKFVATFLDSRCVAVTLQYELKVIRVFSDDRAKKGSYLSTTTPLSRSYIIRQLALRQDWGNRATKQVEATIPVGTTIYIGIAGPQEPPSLYPGGGQQTVVEDPTGVVWGSTRPVPKSRRYH